MKIHREGYSILTAGLVMLIGVNALVFFVLAPVGQFNLIFLTVSLALYMLVIWFFRIPARDFNVDENLVVSPADGKIVAIEETEESEYFNDRRLQVSIFMSPLNVHVNLFPIAGAVKYYKYHPGNYLVAWHPKASEKNERSSVVVEKDPENAIMIRQIAGLLARRIICYANSGERVKQGQELGFIKFGSRVDLFLPLDVNLKVKLGQKVSGKTTVIASFN